MAVTGPIVFHSGQSFTLTWTTSNSNSLTATSRTTTKESEHMSIENVTINPVVPKRGAFLRAKSISESAGGGMVRFKEWVDDTTLLHDETDTPVAAEDFEAATPLLVGKGYERVACLPSSGHVGKVGAITSWRSTQPMVVLTGANSASAFHAVGIAGLAPLLNPATESAKQKVVRLERERDLLEQIVHGRMVAEGVARNWCAEFDPILDSIGLPPRQSKNTVLGTMHFRATLNGYDLKDPATLEAIKARPFDYIPQRDVTITDLEHETEEVGPMLSY